MSSSESEGFESADEDLHVDLDADEPERAEVEVIEPTKDSKKCHSPTKEDECNREFTCRADLSSGEPNIQTISKAPVKPEELKKIDSQNAIAERNHGKSILHFDSDDCKTKLYNLKEMDSLPISPTKLGYSQNTKTNVNWEKDNRTFDSDISESRVHEVDVKAPTPNDSKNSEQDTDAEIKKEKIHVPVSDDTLNFSSPANDLYDERPKSILDKIANVPCPESAAGENTAIEDSSIGWDFEDGDIEFPDSPVKVIQPSKECPSSIPRNENPGWPVWSGWGVSSLISSASEGVSSLSLQMTSGITSMLENTLGAPDPQDLAKQVTAENISEDKVCDRDSTGPKDLFGFGNIIGGVSNLSCKVITGGLDTLETLGKKTMEVLQEGDPGFKKKRALLFQGEKVILSQILRDAKEKGDANDQEKEQDKLFRKAQYETLFDDFHGLVHLEALEMISKQCEIKLQSLMSNSTNCDSLIDSNETINNVKQLFEQQIFSDENETKPTDAEIKFEDKLNSAMDILSLNINIKNIILVDSSIESRLTCRFTDAIEIHTKAISDLALFTASSIELFHRIAELLIVKENTNIETDFQALQSITTLTKYKIGSLSECYSAKIISLSDKSFSPLITNIFLEASNSGTYLENAFELFLPLLQLKKLS